MRAVTFRALRTALCSAGVAAGLLMSAVPASAAVWRANALSGPPYQHWFGFGPTRVVAVDNAMRFCVRHAIRPRTCHIVAVFPVR
jgi:hypothetical protein